MQKKVLGRGLESLIPSLGIDKISTREIVVTISLDKIKPNRFQPRVEFNTESIYELADSIKKYGLVQPILISESIVPGEYEIIAGERRYMASKFAGKKDIKAIVRHFVNTSQRFAMALIENIQREDLNPIEEANAFKKLMEEFGHTHEQISEIVGKNRSVISNTLRLLSLPEDIQVLIREGKITSGHGRILAGIEDISQMRAVVDRILNEKLSVRIVEKIISEFKKKKIEIKYKKQEIGLIHLKEKIQRKFGVKVDIVGTSKKGRIEIYYYTLGDLERIEKEFDF